MRVVLTQLLAEMGGDLSVDMLAAVGGIRVMSFRSVLCCLSVMQCWWFDVRLV